MGDSLRPTCAWKVWHNLYKLSLFLQQKHTLSKFLWTESAFYDPLGDIKAQTFPQVLIKIWNLFIVDIELHLDS